MDYPFKSCSRKLDRAVDHFGALNEAIGKYVRDGKPLTYLPEIDMQRSHYTVRVKIQNPPPPELSLIAGDFIQNVRASLDHLVWQLVKANGQPPTRSNAFPIHSQRPTVKNRGLERWHRQLRGVHPAARRWIEYVQPYRRKNPSHDLLAHLARLSNEDKHRVIFQSVNSVPNPEAAEPRVDIIPVRDVGAIEQYELHAMKPLEDGSIVLELAIDITGANPKIDLEGEMPLDVAFGEPPIPMQGFIQIFDRADVIVGHLSNVCFGTSLGPSPLVERLGLRGHPAVERVE